MLGENIAWIRQERGMSQTNLAEDIGKSRKYVSEIENGKRQPTNQILENIAAALDVELEDLA